MSMDAILKAGTLSCSNRSTSSGEKQLDRNVDVVFPTVVSDFPMLLRSELVLLHHFFE